MKVAIKKDGYVYIDGKPLTEDDFLDILTEFVTYNDIRFKRNDKYGREKYFQAICGTHTFDWLNTIDYYLSDFNDVDSWVRVVRELLDAAESWYEELPVDEKEVDLSTVKIF